MKFIVKENKQVSKQDLSGGRSIPFFVRLIIIKSFRKLPLQVISFKYPKIFGNTSEIVFWKSREDSEQPFGYVLLNPRKNQNSHLITMSNLKSCFNLIKKKIKQIKILIKFQRISNYCSRVVFHWINLSYQHFTVNR